MAVLLEKKRSSNQKYLDDHLKLDLISEGVGAWQEYRHLSGEGGGYLNICTDFEVSLSVQLRELVTMGISKIWLNVAKEIGVSNFLKVWQVLDQQAEQGAEINSSIRVTVPQFDKYFRYQRNQVIKTMAREGTSSSNIQKHLRRKLNIDITIRTIQRIMKQSLKS